MEKMEGTTPNIELNNIDKMKELFPETIVDGKINFDKLKLVLGSEIDSSDERYQFTWNGKNEALKLSQTMSTGSLLPSVEDSKNWDTTQNLYIEGDNLEVLKILQKSYYNKIKMIYIDPPYNTGNDFIYEDDFVDNIKNYKEQTNQSNRANPETSGRYHTDWLNMMYPRLRLARNLLTENGIIFISIDDRELFNLKKICDEIFGESNYINTISLNAKVSAGASGGGEDKRLKKNIEYILMYVKNFNSIETLPAVYKETELMTYIDKMKSDEKSFKYTTVLYKFDAVKPIITIKDGYGDDIVISKVNNYEIKSVKQVAQLENISEEEVYKKYYDKIMTTTNAQTSIRTKVWEATEDDDGMFVATYIAKSGKNKGNKVDLIFMGKQKVLVIWLKDTSYKNDNGIYKQEKIGTYWDGFSWINVTKEGNVRFENGKKPIDLISQMMVLSDCKDNDIVLDFFSGSSSTAHAVMKYNVDNCYNIKYIMVQLPEKVSSKETEYLSYLKSENILPVITEVAKERIRRAGEKIKAELVEKTKQQSLLDGETVDPNKLDIGFKVFKLDSSNIKTWDSDINSTEQLLGQLNLFKDSIKENRTNEDVLYEIILKQGLSLTSSIEDISVKNEKLYSVGKGYMIICLSDKVDLEIVEEIGKLKPQIVIFKDSGFDLENIKLNADQILKRYGVDKENIKTI